MHLAPTLQAFSEGGLREGCQRLAVDLAGCPGMDSTFMGTLVGLSITLRECNGWLCVTNVGPECERLMRMLGLWEVIPVLERSLEGMANFIQIKPDGDPVARLAVIREAHRRLIEIDTGNLERFGSFLEALEREVATRAKT